MFSSSLPLFHPQPNAMSQLLQQVRPFYYDPYLILHYATFAMYPVLRFVPGLFSFEEAGSTSWFGFTKVRIIC